MTDVIASHWYGDEVIARLGTSSDEARAMLGLLRDQADVDLKHAMARVEAVAFGMPMPSDLPEPELPPVPIDAEASYEQWIGLLYACAVFRGVLTHPPPKP